MDAVPCVDNGIEGNRDQLMAFEAGLTVVVWIAHLSWRPKRSHDLRAAQTGCHNLCQYFPFKPTQYCPRQHTGELVRACEPVGASGRAVLDAQRPGRSWRAAR